MATAEETAAHIAKQGRVTLEEAMAQADAARAHRETWTELAARSFRQKLGIRWIPSELWEEWRPFFAARGIDTLDRHELS